MINGLVVLFSSNPNVNVAEVVAKIKAISKWSFYENDEMNSLFSLYTIYNIADKIFKASSVNNVDVTFPAIGYIEYDNVFESWCISSDNFVNRFNKAVDDGEYAILLDCTLIDSFSVASFFEHSSIQTKNNWNFTIREEIDDYEDLGEEQRQIIKMIDDFKED